MIYREYHIINIHDTSYSVTDMSVRKNNAGIQFNLLWFTKAPLFPLGASENIPRKKWKYCAWFTVTLIAMTHSWLASYPDLNKDTP